MTKKQWKKLFNALLKKHMRFTPKDVNAKKEMASSWYGILKNYKSDEVQKALFEIWTSQSQFPQPNELLLKIEKNRLGIGNVRLYLVRKKQEKKKRRAKIQEKRKGLHGRDLLDFNDKLKEESVFPPAIKECIDSFGGNIDDILKYNIKEFSLMITQQLHKKIEKKAYKMLEEK